MDLVAITMILLSMLSNGSVNTSVYKDDRGQTVINTANSAEIANAAGQCKTILNDALDLR